MPRTIVTLGLILGAVSSALFFAGCGDSGDGQFANEATGEFQVEVINAELEPVQTIAETYDMTVAVRNSGDETIPAINVTVDLPGLDSNLAFAYGSQQQGLAMNQRPVWVLEEGYPKLADTTGRGGATTTNRRTFEVGELDPGDTANMVWRLTAVRAGNYRLGFQVGAGLGPDTTAVNASGEVPSGILPVRISDLARLTEINNRGEVVPLSPEDQARVEDQQEQPEPLYP